MTAAVSLSRGPARTPDRHTALIDALGARICGDLLPGTLLVVEDLCAELGASRPAVREALRVLESKGLVHAKRGVGTTTQPRAEWNVSDPDVVRWRLRSADRFNQLRELLELRAAVEPEAAALAAQRSTPGATAALLSAAARLWSLGHQDDPAAFLAADEEFHERLLAASGNVMFAQFAPMITAILRGRFEEGLAPTLPAHPALDVHLALAQAVQAGDAPGARDLAHRLVSATLEESRSLWEGPAPA